MQKRITTISLFISRKKKTPNDSIAIYANNYKSKGVIFPTFFGKKPIKSAEQLPDKLKYDARLVRKRLGHFYLCIPKRLDKYNGLYKTRSLLLILG
jgi:hypothetical protein